MRFIVSLLALSTASLTVAATPTAHEKCVVPELEHLERFPNTLGPMSVQLAGFYGEGVQVLDQVRQALDQGDLLSDETLGPRAVELLIKTRLAEKSFTNRQNLTPLRCTYEVPLRASLGVFGGASFGYTKANQNRDIQGATLLDRSLQWCRHMGKTAAYMTISAAAGPFVAQRPLIRDFLDFNKIRPHLARLQSAFACAIEHLYSAKISNDLSILSVDRHVWSNSYRISPAIGEIGVELASVLRDYFANRGMQNETEYFSGIINQP